MLLAPYQWHFGFPWASCKSTSFPLQKVTSYDTAQFPPLLHKTDRISQLPAAYSHTAYLDSNSHYCKVCETELLHNGSQLLCGACVLASCFQQLCSTGLKLSPVRPKVFDATAWSYLTSVLTVCLHNKYNATWIIQLGVRGRVWEWGELKKKNKPKKQAVLLKGQLRHKGTSWPGGEKHSNGVGHVCKCKIWKLI